MKRHTARGDHGRNLFVCVVSKNLNTPNLSPMAFDAITGGSKGVLGSPFYICAVDTAC